MFWKIVYFSNDCFNYFYFLQGLFLLPHLHLCSYLGDLWQGGGYNSIWHSHLQFAILIYILQFTIFPFTILQNILSAEQLWQDSWHFPLAIFQKEIKRIQYFYSFGSNYFWNWVKCHLIFLGHLVGGDHFHFHKITFTKSQPWPSQKSWMFVRFPDMNVATK